MNLWLLGEPRSIHVRQWARAAADLGHDITLLSLGRETVAGVRQRRALPPWSVLRLDLESLNLLRPAWLRRELRGRDVDLLHCHYLGRVHATALSGLPRDVPLVISVWGDDVVPQGDAWRESTSLREAKVDALRRARAVTATSEFLADAVRSYVDRLVDVIPFGVDESRFVPVASEDSVPRIVFAKHLSKDYGLDTLLEAAARLARATEVRLQIAGCGDLKAWQTRARGLGLSNVEFLGGVPHDQMPQLLAGAALAVMPSRVEESFGVAAVEAAACGVPVVATRVGGVSEVVRDGETGLLVPPEDSAALAEAMGRLLDDRKLRARMGAAGRAMVLANYTWDRCATLMSDVYSRVLSSRDDDRWE